MDCCKGDSSVKKIIAVIGSTGLQGGGLVQAILDDPNGGFAVRALTRDPTSVRSIVVCASISVAHEHTIHKSSH